MLPDGKNSVSRKVLGRVRSAQYRFKHDLGDAGQPRKRQNPMYCFANVTIGVRTR